MREVSPLDVTPLFAAMRITATPADQATGEFAFEAPATLSTYVVRAYAASASGDVFGTSEHEVIVRRTVSLTPAVPRIVRIADNGTVGAVVTYSGTATADAPVSVDITADISGAGELSGPATRTVEFDGSASTTEVRFDVRATATGTVTVALEATRGGLVVDSLLMTVESLLQQAPVTLASSFAVSAAADWQEGLQLPDAYPGALTVLCMRRADAFLKHAMLPRAA